MKFTVHINGADNGLIERLTAAAERKLAPKLKQLAVRHARHVQNGAHAAHHQRSHAAAAHHAVAHHAPAHHGAAHTAIGAAATRAVLRSLSKSGGRSLSHQSMGGDLHVSDPPLDPYQDTPLDTPVAPGFESDATLQSSTSADDANVFDISTDPDLM